MVNWFTDPAWDLVKIKLKLTVRGLKQSVAAPREHPRAGVWHGSGPALTGSGRLWFGSWRDARAAPPRGCMHG